MSAKPLLEALWKTVQGILSALQSHVPSNYNCLNRLYVHNMSTFIQWLVFPGIRHDECCTLAIYIYIYIHSIFSHSQSSFSQKCSLHRLMMTDEVVMELVEKR